jgi:hypothetical protein
MRVSKMVRHDLKLMSADDLWSVHKLVASARAESETHAGKFRAQRQRFQRLNEYCNQAVAEIRTSLDRPQDEGS